MTIGQRNLQINQEELNVETTITVKEVIVTLDDKSETFYHSFYKEDGKVQAFSVMTEIKGK